jgi:hypothetical protein
MCWLRMVLRPYEASPFPRPRGLTDKREGRFAILIILDGRRERNRLSAFDETR